MRATMREETAEARGPLRHGYTTGSCATAAALAAARLLLGGVVSERAEIILPRGERVTLSLTFCRYFEAGPEAGKGAGGAKPGKATGRTLDERRDACPGGDCARAHACPYGAGVIAEAGTIKDAGDDPDVTHGALVFARVRLLPEPGVRFRAGPGVGTVTRAGLVLPVGEPAINPVPRQMMSRHLASLAATHGYRGGFETTIGIEQGEALALRTMNPRLGIVGGLSILGTTGIVRPFSCSAYIASIHQGIDVARANGQRHLAACTGNASEAAMRAYYGLPDMALIEMGDFVGAVLKHLRRAPIDKLSLCGGFGKFSKLAAGHLDLHSQHSLINLEQLSCWAADGGASPALQAELSAANTSQHALALAHKAGVPLGDVVCARARAVALDVVPAGTRVEVFAIDRAGSIVGTAR